MKNAGLSPDILSETGAFPVLPQSAALCYRLRRGVPEILLITTRGSGRWIIPKGRMIDGLSGAETAAQEAWEEAGVTGCCETRSIGQFSFDKHHRDLGRVTCVVDVYPLLVAKTADRFPEVAERRRRWMLPEKAAQAVSIGGLSGLLRSNALNPH
ncbi:NUDIX hydrolase [Ruegeria arenilitoris]|uniref:NUDIX domain protein n=1 Tax=Ruegeria arenilitoris TaxID=1173585 RepID=A0A238JZP0_9RHOB|nr:NUDIX hydrolase [Ruegeria arenilitoris]SMX36109.1 NUDIX domain protein [Ruegeria arenilitoris]